MRPTRWTKKRRVTYFGKGGWHIGRYGFNYTHPATGNGVGAGWNLPRILSMRRKQEAERRRNAAEAEMAEAYYEWYRARRSVRH